MLTKEYTIIEPFVRMPWKGLTFRQIKELSRNKSDNYVHTVLKKMVKNNILEENRAGNVIIYSLADATNALNTAGFVAEYKADAAKHLPHQNLRKILAKIKTSFYSFIITGSYSKGKQRENSDLDVVVICDNAHKPNTILSEIKIESELMTPEAHPYVFTESQFYEMLVNNEENYGKEIARNNLIITGGRQYYSILMKAIKHGFNG